MPSLLCELPESGLALPSVPIRWGLGREGSRAPRGWPVWLAAGLGRSPFQVLAERPLSMVPAWEPSSLLAVLGLPFAPGSHVGPQDPPQDSSRPTREAPQRGQQ